MKRIASVAFDFAGLLMALGVVLSSPLAGRTKLTDADFYQNKMHVVGRNGKRYIKCRECVLVGDTSNFVEYGGIGSMNLGLCRDCARKRQ